MLRHDLPGSDEINTSAKARKLELLVLYTRIVRWR